MITWTEWKRTNADKLSHPMGFEERFVELVLERVALIEPRDVQPQYHFVDEDGRPRRVDFMIRNDARGYMLPIELDGAAKDQTGREWSDFLFRQNALVRSFGVVLRYSNAQMFNNAGSIVDEISRVLAIQAASKDTRDYVSKAVESVVEDAMAGARTLQTINRSMLGRSESDRAIAHGLSRTARQAGPRPTGSARVRPRRGDRRGMAWVALGSLAGTVALTLVLAMLDVDAGRIRRLVAPADAVAAGRSGPALP